MVLVEIPISLNKCNVKNAELTRGEDGDEMLSLSDVSTVKQSNVSVPVHRRQMVSFNHELPSTPKSGRFLTD